MFEEIVSVSVLADKYDDDGLTLITFAKRAVVYDGISAKNVNQKLKGVRPDGSTNLAQMLEFAFKKAASSSKKTVILVYTDGVPDSQTAVINEINKAGKKLGRAKVGLILIQVGEDTQATKFLDYTDNALDVDITATIDAKNAALTTVPHLVWMAFNK